MKTKGYTIEDGKVVERDYWDSKEEAYEALAADLHSLVAQMQDAEGKTSAGQPQPEQLEMAFPPAKARKTHRCRLSRRVQVRSADGRWHSFPHFLSACTFYAGGEIGYDRFRYLYAKAIADTPKETAEKRCEVLCEIQRLSGAKQPIERVLSYGLDGKEYDVEMEEAKKEVEA